MLRTVILVTAILCLVTTACAADPFITLCFEAETPSTMQGKGLAVASCTDDKAGGVSGEKVLVTPMGPKGKRVEGSASYRIRIPETGTYFLWARTFWSTGCGNSFLVAPFGRRGSQWVLGGDGTYNAFHWVCLSDSGDNASRPRPLHLKKGTVELVLIANERGARIDQFLLTTDRQKTPAGIYPPTAGAVESKQSSRK